MKPMLNMMRLIKMTILLWGLKYPTKKEEEWQMKHYLKPSIPMLPMMTMT